MTVASRIASMIVYMLSEFQQQVGMGQRMLRALRLPPSGNVRWLAETHEFEGLKRTEPQDTCQP